MNHSTYSEIRETRDTLIKGVSHNHFKLNELHDEIMQNVVRVAIKKTTEDYGSLPSPFSFFSMGSAGRLEQTVWSDQDHGIIYDEQSGEAKTYFLLLGKEISDGLFHAGYNYCDGGVMASNPLWCKSMLEWQQQLTSWILESSWQSIRNLLIFADGRSLYGESKYIDQLKSFVYDSFHHEHMLLRVLNNTMNLKKGVGVLGQFLVETHGPFSGMFNIKNRALFPYINAARLLAIKEKSVETTTLLRLNSLPFEDKKRFKSDFLKLLDYRLSFGNHSDYSSGHYLLVSSLTNGQKKELKDIIKNGQLLFQHVKRLVEKGD